MCYNPVKIIMYRLYICKKKMFKKKTLTNRVSLYLSQESGSVLNFVLAGFSHRLQYPSSLSWYVLTPQNINNSHVA